MTSPWWTIGPARPVTVWDHGTGWGFFFDSTEITSQPEYRGRIEAVCSFRFVLTDEQIMIAHRLVQDGTIIQGSYQSWAEFMAVHRELGLISEEAQG